MNEDQRVASKSHLGQRYMLAGTCTCFVHLGHVRTDNDTEKDSSFYCTSLHVHASRADFDRATRVRVK